MPDTNFPLSIRQTQPFELSGKSGVRVFRVKAGQCVGFSFCCSWNASRLGGISSRSLQLVKLKDCPSTRSKSLMTSLGGGGGILQLTQSILFWIWTENYKDITTKYTIIRILLASESQQDTGQHNRVWLLFFVLKMDGKGNVSYWCLSYPLSAWWMRRLRVLREAVDPFRSDPWHDLTLQKSVCVGSVSARSLLWYDESTEKSVVWCSTGAPTRRELD